MNAVTCCNELKSSASEDVTVNGFCLAGQASNCVICFKLSQMLCFYYHEMFHWEIQDTSVWNEKSLSLKF